MSKMKREMEARCELAMMGKVIPVNDNSEVQAMTEYIVTVLTGDASNLVDIMENAINRYQNNVVKYIVCNRVQGMNCITYLLDSGIEDPEDEYWYPAPFEEDYGTPYKCAFCYVFNLESDWCSEFGDCFFEKKSDGYYHRVS